MNNADICREIESLNRANMLWGERIGYLFDRLEFENLGKADRDYYRSEIAKAQRVRADNVVAIDKLRDTLIEGV